MTDDSLIAYISESTDNCKLALTDRSYRTKYQREMKEKNKGKPKGDHDNEPIPINFNLGTLGDAVLRLSLTEILYHNGKEIDISEERKKYEPDKVLVEKIAPYYGLREILRFDDENEDKNHGYDYWEYKGSGDHPQKFLATAMEALLGAYYLDHDESMGEVEQVVRKWMEIVDGNQND